MTSWSFQFSKISQENILVSLIQIFDSLKLWFSQKVGRRWFMLFKSHLGKKLSCGRWCASFFSVKKRNSAMLKIKSLRVLRKIIYFCSIPWITDCVRALLDPPHCTKPMPEASWSAWRNMNILLFHQTISLLVLGSEALPQKQLHKSF